MAARSLLRPYASPLARSTATSRFIHCDRISRPYFGDADDDSHQPGQDDDNGGDGVPGPSPKCPRAKRWTWPPSGPR